VGARLDRPAARAVNKIGHALHRRDPVFGPFFRDARWRDVLASLGQEPRLVQSMLIFKPPEVGGEVRWHQDASYLATEPDSVIGLWWALEDATAENGALQVVPGGHAEPVRIRFRRSGRQTRHDLLDARPFDALATTLEVPRGTLVVLHGHLPHASPPNRSARSRVAATLHSVDARTIWAADNWILDPG
jgi:phytanoyl-CoA hydroxylase